ncbi:MAG: sugar ABC transporter substrate-binding protein [Alicyclobacillus herbarius]|uniref:ABC transporter substrate-binding protein n=1 Tax=Alicyclobacillus herbarius TaxID=122960 RepID=UPI0023574A4F|nr:sugar ABC transporter substrate-binding protein [Alicyclobacillus herbarius]MCL6633651.1 sugar ABC transporter substrate-binding protein [Alicyclobacillus herbarius]
MKLRKKRMVLVVALVLSSTATACGHDDVSGNKGVINMTWSTWGNPGELKRFFQLTDDYNRTHPHVHWTLIPVPANGYLQKIQTELVAGNAPDVFYMGDGDMSTYVKDHVLVNLTPLLGTGPYPHKISDWPSGVWGAAKQGKNVYGLPPDINPMVMYFNKTVLAKAGVKTSPSQLYKEGKWNWKTFQLICSKVKATGKYGYIVDNAWNTTYSWVSANGGQVYDSQGNFIANKNSKAIQAFEYLQRNIKNGNFVYSGSLPKGQGDDAMFMSQQAAFVAAGRWLTPEFNADKELNYDIVPWPTNTGNKNEPAGIAAAYVGINKSTKNVKLAWDFVDYFCSAPGVKFRLSNGGNAVPALSHGADQVVSEGKPAHAEFWLQGRNTGFAIPKAETKIPGVSLVITQDLDLAFLGKQDIKTTLNQVAADIQRAKQNNY